MPPPITRRSNCRLPSASKRSRRVGTRACIEAKLSQFPCMPPLGGPGRRVAIVAGVRTPFARAGTAFKHLSAIELGKLCVSELIQRTDLEAKLVESVVYGTVVPSVIAPNIAREVSLLPVLPKDRKSVV